MPRRKKPASAPAPKPAPKPARVRSRAKTAAAAGDPWAAPDWLDPWAAQVYPALLAEIGRRGRRELAQPYQLAALAQSLAQYRAATIEITRDGVTLTEQHETFEVLKSHPALKAQADAKAAIRELTRDLGLNDPLSEDDADALEELTTWLDGAAAGLPG